MRPEILRLATACCGGLCGHGISLVCAHEPYNIYNVYIVFVQGGQFCLFVQATVSTSFYGARQHALSTNAFYSSLSSSSSSPDEADSSSVSDSASGSSPSGSPAGPPLSTVCGTHSAGMANPGAGGPGQSVAVRPCGAIFSSSLPSAVMSDPVASQARFRIL